MSKKTISCAIILLQLYTAFVKLTRAHAEHEIKWNKWYLLIEPSKMYIGRYYVKFFRFVAYYVT